MINEQKQPWQAGEIAFCRQSSSLSKASVLRSIVRTTGQFVVFKDVGSDEEQTCKVDPMMQSRVWQRLSKKSLEDQLLMKIVQQGVLVDTDCFNKQVVINSRALQAEKKVVELTQEIARLNAKLSASVPSGKCQIPGQCKTLAEIPTLALMEVGFSSIIVRNPSKSTSLS